MYNQPQPHIPFHIHEPKIYNESHLIKQWSTIKPGSQFTSQSGETVTVINCGELNRFDGPDFLNAKIIINGRLKMGSIEFHINASDWYIHGHDKNKRYDDVVLHVVNNYSSGKKNPNIPVIVLSKNFIAIQRCALPHQIQTVEIVNVLRFYAEQRWKSKTKLYIGLHNTSVQLLNILINNSFSILGANGNKNNFKILSNCIDLNVIKDFSVKNIESYLIQLGGELDINWNTKSIRPAHHPSRRMRLAAELIKFLNGIVMKSSISRFNIIEGFYSHCPSARGKSIQTEIIGNVLIPFVASHNLHIKNFNQYNKLHDRWYDLKLSSPYHKFVKKFSRIINASSLKYFWVMQGAIQLDKVWCKNNLCNICPLVISYDNY